MTGGDHGGGTSTVEAGHAMVASVDRLATEVGVDALRDGGSAVDAAIATNAVLAVTHPHMCGPGGDLFALVHDAATGSVTALDACGRAGSRADLDRLRADGHTRMPMTADLRAATIPGCVDGWVALHERHGRLPLPDLVAPAVALARDGFAASPLLALLLSIMPTRADDDLAAAEPAAGDRLRAPALAATLEAVGAGGRGGFYGGAFGDALVGMDGDVIVEDVRQAQARWVHPISIDVWGHRAWTVPPPSQGYLILAGAAIAERAAAGRSFPDPGDAAWPHLLSEAVTAIGRHRLAELHDGADPAALLDPARLDRLAGGLDLGGRSTATSPPAGPGDTTYLGAVDGDGLAVSLIQSLAGPFGCHLSVPGTGVWLQNRGIGFSLDPGHPAAYGPGRRPPHTLSPALVTRPDGTFRAVLGTQGGDAQPFVVSQLLARLLAGRQPPGAALGGARVLPHHPAGVGFDLWDADDHVLRIEANAPAGWRAGLERRGHRVEVADPTDGVSFGHAQLIERRPDGRLAGACDPRSGIGAAAGF